MACFKKNNKDKKSTEPVGQFADVAAEPEINKGSNKLKRYFYPDALGNTAILKSAVNLSARLKDTFSTLITAKSVLQLQAQEGSLCAGGCIYDVVYFADAAAQAAGCCDQFGGCSPGSACPAGYETVTTHICTSYAIVYTVYECCPLEGPASWVGECNEWEIECKYWENA